MYVDFCRSMPEAVAVTMTLRDHKDLDLALKRVALLEEQVNTYIHAIEHGCTKFFFKYAHNHQRVCRGSAGNLHTMFVRFS